MYIFLHFHNFFLTISITFIIPFRKESFFSIFHNTLNVYYCYSIKLLTFEKCIFRILKVFPNCSHSHIFLIFLHKKIGLPSTLSEILSFMINFCNVLREDTLIKGSFYKSLISYMKYIIELREIMNLIYRI